MLEARGNLWSFHDAGHWVCITTNTTLDRNRHLVMGGGCAREAKRRFHDVPQKWGTDTEGTRAWRDYRLVQFPVKTDWRQPAILSLIKQSAHQLMVIMDQYDWIEGPVYLPRPGCGLGTLQWDDVRPILEPILDDRVVVVTF